MKKIAKLLKADFKGSSDLAEIAAMLTSKGRGNDTLLAHITPREAEILKAAGGSGTINPETGLLEFFDEAGFEGITPEQVSAAEPAPSSGEVAAQQFPDYGATPATTQSAGLPFTTGGEQVYAPVQTAQAPAGAEQTIYPGEISAPPRQPTAREAFELGRVAQTPPASEKTDFLDKLTKGLSSQDMIRLGLAGGLGVMGQQQAKKAAGQAQAASAEQKALAQPYQAKGQEMIRAAEAGELTPTGQQALQATQARIAQGVEARGGVGAQQAAAQVESFRQQLLQQQYNYGLQVAQVGDSIALGAIKTGLAADQAVQQATGQFYTSLASIAAGLPLARTTP